MLLSTMTSNNTLRTRNAVADKVPDSVKLPLSGQMVWVQCKGYRCLAFRDAQGKWVNFYSGEKLSDFIRVVN